MRIGISKEGSTRRATSSSTRCTCCRRSSSVSSCTFVPIKQATQVKLSRAPRETCSAAACRRSSSVTKPVYFCTSKASKVSSTPRNTLCSSTADEKAACDQGGIVRTPPLYVRLATFLRLGFATPPPPCSSSNVSICTVFVLLYPLNKSYLYFCTSAGKQVN